MISLAQVLHRRKVVEASQRRHRPRALPIAPLPRGPIVQLTAVMRSVSRELDDAIDAELVSLGVLPRRADAGEAAAGWAGSSEVLAARLGRVVGRILGRRHFIQQLDAVAANVAAFSREQFGRQVRAALGIDLPKADPSFELVFRDFRLRNTGLIKTMAERKVMRVRRVLHEAGTSTRVEEIAKRLREETGITDRHADLISRDQVLKLNGEVTQKRHEAAGVEQYIWRTSEDGRVRETHRELDGTRHRYDQPPIVDPKRGRRENPGGDYQCRCTMEPVIEGFDELLEPGQTHELGTASPIVWSPVHGTLPAVIRRNGR